MATAPTAPAGAPANTTQGSSGKGKQMTTVPFRCGTQNTTNLDGYSQTVSLSSTAAPTLGNYNPSVNSYLRGLWITASAPIASGNSATVTFLPDAPFSLFAQVSFLDTQQRPIVQVTGLQLAMIRKYGGYFLQGDARADNSYVATTGSGATGGSFNFTLWVPLEINNRTGVGSALNKNSAQTYTLQMTLALSRPRSMALLRPRCHPSPLPSSKTVGGSPQQQTFPVLRWLRGRASPIPGATGCRARSTV